MTQINEHLTTISSPRVGAIFAALPMDAAVDRASLVLVTAVDTEFKYARAALLTPRTRFATDTDVRLLCEESGYHVDLLAQSDLGAPLWWSQFDRQVAFVEPALAAAIGQAIETEFDGVPPDRRGLPVLSPDDPRWQFKQSQLEALQHLAGDCVRQLMSGALDRVDLDPALVRQALEGDEHARVAVGGTGSSRPRPVPLDFLEEMQAANVDLRSMGVDGARILEQLMRESVSESARLPLSLDARWQPSRSDASGGSALDRLLTLRKAQGETCVRLRTTAAAWDHQDVPQVAVARFHSSAIQLNCETEALSAA